MEDWARTTEDEMVRGVYVRRAKSDQTMVGDAIDRYVREITPTKEESTRGPVKGGVKPGQCGGVKVGQ